MRKAQTGYEEKHSHYEDSSALDTDTQRGCATSNLGGFQDPSGQSPGQPGLTSALAPHEQEVGLETSCSLFSCELSYDPTVPMGILCPKHSTYVAESMPNTVPPV